MQGDEFAGRRCNFVHSTIGVITNETGKHNDINGIINTLMQIHKMADCPNRSNYLIERQKFPEKTVFKIAKQIIKFLFMKQMKH